MRRGEAFRPFEIDTDYRLYVDGKPRFDGARDFLTSRGIQLPDGSPHDPPHAESVCGLANRKDGLVNKIIQEKGVEPYEGSVRFIRQLRHQGFKTAVVTSSEHCETVLTGCGKKPALASHVQLVGHSPVLMPYILYELIPETTFSAAC